jgi:hypothetical protein
VPVTIFRTRHIGRFAEADSVKDLMTTSTNGFVGAIAGALASIPL